MTPASPAPIPAPATPPTPRRIPILGLLVISAAVLLLALLFRIRTRAAAPSIASGSPTLRIAPAPPVVAQPDSPTPAPTSPVLSGPAGARPVGEPLQEGPFRETPIETETPEIHVHNEEGLSAEFIVYTDGGPQVLDASGPDQYIEVPAGEHRYELRGSYYARSGEPDQDGTLRCRRFRRYDIFLTVNFSNGTEHQDLGDE